MIVVTYEQHTPEWFAARRGLPTASKFASIIMPKKREYAAAADAYINALIDELARPVEAEAESFAGNRHTRRGEMLEPEALGAYAFDPLAFAKAEPRKQYDILKGFVSDFDFDANAGERKKAFDARTDVNRRAASSKAAAEAIQLPPGPCPKAVDVSAVLAQINEAATHNASIETVNARKAALLREAAEHAGDEKQPCRFGIGRVVARHEVANGAGAEDIHQQRAERKWRRVQVHHQLY